MKKTVCFTIDVEPDYASLLSQQMYSGKSDIPKLIDLANKRQLKITAFVTGMMLEQNPDIVDQLNSMGAEIEQHSYSHEVGHKPKSEDIELGITTHEKVIGRRPLGYRAPQGVITLDEAMLLQSLGIKFDSSIFPTFFPGRFNRLGFPHSPFTIKGSNLMEIPFAVIPRIRIPLGLSYIQLIGVRTLKTISRLFGLPELIVFDFHSYEFGKVSSYSQLRMFDKLVYYRAQRIYRDPFFVLEEVVDYLLSKGYEPKYMIDVYNEVKDIVPIWEWSKH